MNSKQAKAIKSSLGRLDGHLKRHDAVVNQIKDQHAKLTGLVDQATAGPTPAAEGAALPATAGTS